VAVPFAFVSVAVVTVIGPVPGRPPRSRPRGSCSVNHRMPVTESRSVKNMDVVDWGDLGREMWDYLTDKGAAINYQFVNMTVEVRATPASRLRGRPGSWMARCGSPEENAGKPM